MRKPKKKKLNAQDRYRWVYDAIISKLYDSSLKIGLSIIGEQRLRETVINFISPYVKRKDSILDLCCGTGTLTTMLANSVYTDCNIVGVDLSEGQIFQAIEKNYYSNLEFKIMDASNLKFPSESFDIILISAALHEMNKAQRLRVLQEVHRVLGRKGYLFIFDHHEPSEPKLRIFYNFYIGFWEKLLSHSSDMQRNIFSELKAVKFNPINQIILNKKIYKFFQLIISRK